MQGVQWLHEVQPPPIDPDPRSFRQRSTGRDLLVVTLIVVALVGVGFGIWWYTGTQSADQSSTETVVSGENRLIQRVVDDGSTDDDNDGLTNEHERRYGTAVDRDDTDGDGFDDATEIRHGFSPLSAGPGVRMIDSALVDRLAVTVSNARVISSGLASTDGQRYYLVYDGATTTYYADDGSVQAQCAVGQTNDQACDDLPNAVRTDFTRTIDGASTTDVYHLPF